MNELLSIGFLKIRVVDVIDIAVIAVLFYYVYRTLRDTSAIQVLILLVIVLGLGFATEAANMLTLNWLLRRIGDIGLIAFVVLFQPELRRVLLLITQWRGFRWFVRSTNQETIDDVVEAVRDMAAKHIGALIVFSRAELVKLILETGIVMQAAVSTELILSIFNPRSPLHDGAIVIDNRSLTAARCVLPLSSHQRWNGKNLGTRHRAGLGLSEQADVVVLIVSEETGGISIAYQGDFTMDIDITRLRDVLSEYLATMASS